jgi:hypothetical protein
MKIRSDLDVIRVEDDQGRSQALEVMRETYRNEKNWIVDDEKLVSSSDIAAPNISWFVARAAGQPVGVLRVLYDPPLALYAEYGFKLVQPDLDLDAFIRKNRIAEIGRFAVMPNQRTNPLIAPALIREAGNEAVMRGTSHYITDVFEGERHSPFRFHTRVLGFQVVATHDVGELNCSNRRLTMVLNIPECYGRLEYNRKWLFRYLTERWGPDMHDRLRKLKDTHTQPLPAHG